MMVSTTAGGRPLKSATSRPGATHGGSIDLDAVAIWCRAPERGVPSSEECAREVLSRGNVFGKPGPGGPVGRPPMLLVLSLHSVCASRLTGGNAYLRKARGQLCASASVLRGPLVREKCSWQWEDSGEANRSTCLRLAAYRLWTEDADVSSKWRRFMGTGTPRLLSPPGECLATPPSRVVRMEEADERLLAVKGAIHNFVSSSCTSGKKGTGVERGCELRPALRNQSSNCEGSGLGVLLTSSPILTAALAIMAVSSGSGAAVATTSEGGSPTAPSSSEDVNPSPEAAIDILSTDGAPNEMLGAPWDGPAKSPGNRTECSLREE